MTSHHVTEQIVRTLSKWWWVVTTALLIVGVAVNYDLVSDEDLGPLAASAEVAAGDDNQLAVAAEHLESLPSVTYAGLNVAVAEARAIPVNQSGRPIVVVDLVIHNSTTVQARVPVNMLRLTRGGRSVEVERFEYGTHANRIVVEPGQTTQALAVFKMNPGPIGLLGGYDLEIGEPGRWPVTIGLDGTVADDAFPLPLVAAASAETGTDAVQYQGLRVGLLDAESALEYGPYRAPIGQHLAVISVDVSGPWTVVDRSLWTLVDSTGQSRAVRAEAGRRNADGTVATVTLVFSYSTDSAKLELQVGRSDRRETVARFDVQPFE